MWNWFEMWLVVVAFDKVSSAWENQQNHYILLCYCLVSTEKLSKIRGEIPGDFTR